MSDNVLVIGNGFDLAHGLKTKYSDFMEWVKSFNGDYSSLIVNGDSEFIVRIKENGFIEYFFDYMNTASGWVDLEKLIREIVDYFELFFLNYSNFIDNRCSISWDSSKVDMSQGEKMRAMYCLFMFPLYNQDNSRGYINSKHLYKKYYTNEYGLNKKEILKLLKSQLEDLIQLLKIYLKNSVEEKTKDIAKIEQISRINPSYVISFNYTDTYKTYGINPDDVFHIHGSLDKDNMVLGFNDENPNNLDFVYFKKYFQRIQKLTGYIDRYKMYEYNDTARGDAAIVHFYGHSMDKTDGDIIQKLYSMSSGFVIYTYDQEDYEQKVINLIDVFGKDNAIEMIQTGKIKFVPCE